MRTPAHRRSIATSRLPVAASIAVSAPAPVPPRKAITFVPSAIGELAVPNSCGVGGAFLRHSSLPVARSCAEKMPLMPSVKTRPSAIERRRFGPWAVTGRRRIHRVRRIDAVLPELFAGGEIEGRDDFAIALPRVDDDAIAGDRPARRDRARRWPAISS